MVTVPTPSQPHSLARIYSWQRMVLALGLAGSLGFLISTSFPTTPAYLVAARQMLVGLVALTAFGIFETWPARLPRWIPRWTLQVFATGLVIPFTVTAIYVATTGGGEPPFYRVRARMTGFAMHAMSAFLIAPWVAVAALFYQRDAAARGRELAFSLEKSELERKALDARLRLVQAQVEPHFLFNTLANIRELVDSGSPRASTVLDSLITYLRGVVPRLHDPITTLGQEVQLVRAYLQLMQMRMPDRLQFTLQVDPEALPLQCPPTTLLTLVENAIRHGIDPSEEGGRIEVCAKVADGRCRVQVRDTGVGLKAPLEGSGTGLDSLRERLQLIFGAEARLRLHAVDPPGTCAEVEFPARNDALSRPGPEATP